MNPPTPLRDFDSTESVLNKAMDKSPEFSSHDYDRIASLTWLTHSIDTTVDGYDPTAKTVDPDDHEQLDRPVRRYFWEQETHTMYGVVGDPDSANCRIVPVAESGTMDPFDKWNRDPMSDELWETCVSNIAAHLPNIPGIEVDDYFPGRLRKTVDQLREQPEWQSRPDELLKYAVDQHAEIIDEERVTHYLSPSEREPAWMEDAPTRVRPKTEIHD